MPDKTPRPRPDRSRPKETPPDQIKITALQAERLAALSDLDVREVQDHTVAELSDKFKFRIDPDLFFFRTICGRVVKRDPATGIEYPVAYATVIVEDTDCSLLAYFPKLSPWGWYFPFKCRREVIAVKKTDKCGNFCIRVPRWDIDWILRWRRERICFPVIFERPTIADLLDDLVVREPRRVPPKPGPDPDPSWLLGLDRGQLLMAVEQRAGRDAARKVGGALNRLSFGANAARALDVLQEDAFEAPFPPPLPDDVQLLDRIRAGKDERKGAGDDGGAGALATTLGARLGFDPAEFRDLDVRRFLGPFRRCYDRVFPEWAPILDVPDITFRVTQDTNGDGTEETIYSEGLFQVRWNAGTLPPVKLVASSNAISIPECGEIIPIPCGNVPEIVRAGRMPVRGDATMYNPTTGYALRPNRPKPTGNPDDVLPRDEAQTPFWGTVPLFGCVDVETPATHYRILDSYSSDEVNFSPFDPVLGQAWWLTRLDASGNVTLYHYVTPDPQGWYPITVPMAGSPHEWEPQNLLLDWNTRQFGDGKHILRIELGAGSPIVPLAPQPATDPVAFHVDNAAPHTTFVVEYRKNAVGPFLPLNFPCPLVRRGAKPQMVEFRVTFTAAARHLRDVSVGGNGCGGGDITYQSGAPPLWFPNAGGTGVGHWHVAVNDNSVVITAFFRLEAAALQGTYSFGATANSRAINTAGGDTGHLVVPMYQYDHVDIYSTPSFAFSVIDAD